jgi:glycerophosphoryl diester phosphodiesterase
MRNGGSLLDGRMRQAIAMASLPSWITGRPIAHRGLHDSSGGVPENSLAAFENAVAGGYPAELDVRLLADGRLVVFHDRNLKRLTGDPRDVADCAAADLRGLRLCNTDQHVPLLGEVLETVDGRTPLLIEVKNDSRDDRRPERALGRELAGYGGPVAVQSFNLHSVKWFEQHLPQVPRGQLASDFGGGDKAGVELAGSSEFALQHLLLNRYAEPAFIAYDARCLSAWAPRQRRLAGLPVLAWTVRCPAEMHEALKYCDNVIFEGFRPGGAAAGGP